MSKKVESKLPFVFISANDINIEENEYFGILGMREFEKVKGKKSFLHKIDEDYKKERSA